MRHGFLDESGLDNAGMPDVRVATKKLIEKEACLAPTARR
jgi:hypothetical protein